MSFKTQIELRKEIEELEKQIMLRTDKYSRVWTELVIKKEKLQALLQQSQEIIKEIDKIAEKIDKKIEKHKWRSNDNHDEALHNNDVFVIALKQSLIGQEKHEN